MDFLIYAEAMLYNTDDEDDEEELDHLNRKYNCGDSAFNLSNRCFRKIFRLNKESARELIRDLTPLLKPQTRSSALTVETKVIIFLHYNLIKVVYIF